MRPSIVPSILPPTNVYVCAQHQHEIPTTSYSVDDMYNETTGPQDPQLMSGKSCSCPMHSRGNSLPGASSVAENLPLTAPRVLLPKSFFVPRGEVKGVCGICEEKIRRNTRQGIVSSMAVPAHCSSSSPGTTSRLWFHNACTHEYTAAQHTTYEVQPFRHLALFWLRSEQPYNSRSLMLFNTTTLTSC